MNQNMNRIAHTIILEHITEESICLDATAGNGHDTVFLAKHAKQVYAIDIQEQAINATKLRLKEANLDAMIILGSHDQLVQFFDDNTRFDIIMYNLGYLPHSNHQIITTADTTVSSLRQALKFLSIGGIVTITIYTGHVGGQDEATAVEALLSSLDKHQYLVQKISYLNRKQSPYLIVVQKIQ